MQAYQGSSRGVARIFPGVRRLSPFRLPIRFHSLSENRLKNIAEILSAKQKSERSKRGVKQVNAPFFSYPLFIFSFALFFYFLFVGFFLCIFEIFSATLLRIGVKVAKHPGMLPNSSPGLRLRKNVTFYTKQEFSTTHYIDD